MKCIERRLQKLNNTRGSKNSHWWLFWLSQTAYQGNNHRPGRGNASWKGNHDIKWKKSLNLAITVDPEDLEIAQSIRGNTGDNYTRLEIPFNSLVTVFGRERYWQNNTAYVCVYQNTRGKTLNIWEWFNTRAIHVLAH